MREKLFKNTYFFLFLGLSSISGMLIPFLNSKGFNPIETGTLISSFTLAGVVSQFLAGFICDKFKTIKKILLPLLISSVIFGVVSIVFDIGIVFYISFILLGFSSNVLVSLVDSFVLESDDYIKTKFGNLRSFASIGWAIGVLCTGFLASRFGYGVVSILFCISLCIAIFLVYTLKDVKKSNSNKIQFKSLLVNQKYNFVIITLLLINICFRSYFQLVPYTLNTLGGNTSSIGIYYFIGSVSEIIMLNFSMKIMHKISPDKMLIICPIIILTQLLILYFSRDIIFIFISAALQMFTYPLIIVIGRIMVDRVCSSDIRTTSQLIGFAIYSSFAVVIASLLIGFLVESYEIYIAIISISILTLICVFMCILFDRKTLDETL